MTTRALLVLVASFALGCGGPAVPSAPSEPAPSGHVVTVASVPSGSSVASAPTAESPQVPLPRHDMPTGAPSKAAPALGTPCAAPGTAGCGKAGRIAVETTRFGGVKPGSPFSAPCKLRKTQGAGHSPFDTSVCVEDGRVYISRICVMCRMPGYETYKAVLAELTTEQAQDLQRVAGLPLEPVLATDRAFGDAITKAAATAGGP